MGEKSNFELLSDFAYSSNRKITTKEQAYPNTGLRTFQKFKRSVYIPNNDDHTSYFVCFSDPYAKIAQESIFCGAFIPLHIKNRSGISIRKKSILDKINVFSRNNSFHSGNSRFDSQVIIEGNVGMDEQKLLSKHKLQDLILKSLDSKDFLKISINEYNLDFVPELKDSSYIAIVNPQNWNVEPDYIEDLFMKVEKIRSVIVSV